jgi:hypothetical protein
MLGSQKAQAETGLNKVLSSGMYTNQWRMCPNPQSDSCPWQRKSREPKPRTHRDGLSGFPFPHPALSQETLTQEGLHLKMSKLYYYYFGFFETGNHYVVQVGLCLSSAGIIGMHHHTKLSLKLVFYPRNFKVKHSTPSISALCLVLRS